MVPNIYEEMTFPDKSSHITKKEGEFIYSFLKNKGIKKTLEIGLWSGCSAAYIISATKSKHIAIDPYQKHANWMGIENLKKIKLIKFLKLEEDFSYNILPRLVKENLKIDFAFIDGMHLFDYIFVDFFYIDLLLNLEGYVLFHDLCLRQIQLVSDWIKKNRKDYRLIQKEENLILFQKIGQDKRSWNNFKEFYRRRYILQFINYLYACKERIVSRRDY